MSVASQPSTKCNEADCCDLHRLVNEMRLSAEGGQGVSAERVLSWAAALEANLPPHSPQHEEETPHVTDSNSIATASKPNTPLRVATASPPADLLPSDSTESHSEEEERCGFPIVADRGRLEVRCVSEKLQLPTKQLSNVVTCVYAVLRNVVNQLGCENVALYVPHRGSDSDFRLLCSISHKSRQKNGGSTILRGANSMEVACMQTGYVINIAPKTAFSFGDGDKHRNTAPIKQHQQADTQSAELNDAKWKKAAPARMCCPVRTDVLKPPIAVISAVGKGTMPFDQENENFVADAALIVASLIQGCDDVGALQKCFAQSDYRTALPQLSEVVVPSRGTQLVYRANELSPHLVDSIRVVTKSGAVVQLREGSPLISVFQHMEKIQRAWTSSVKLNIELKADNEKKALQLTQVYARLADVQRHSMQ